MFSKLPFSRQGSLRRMSGRFFFSRQNFHSPVKVLPGKNQGGSLMLNSKHKTLNSKGGLTLIEILVSITIFSVVIGIITDVTLNMIRAEAIATSNQVALDNGRFILQRIAKAVRVSVIKTPSNLNSSEIELEHPRRGIVKYFLNSGRIVEQIGGLASTNSFLDSSSVTVENFKFNIKGADDGMDNRQPQVTIIMKLKPPNARQQELPSINIQTTLSQRCLDKSSSCQAI